MDGGLTFSCPASSRGVNGPWRSSTDSTVNWPGVMSSVLRSRRSRRETCMTATRSSAAMVDGLLAGAVRGGMSLA